MVLQLAKTTPYLSGQQRIDVELKKDSGYISTGNIHVVPLSDNIIYNENDKRSAFNYSHEDNIKYLFSQTQDTFWSDVKCRKDTLYYSDHYIDLYDHTYQSGSRRIRYKRYNKQFSYLMPVWIDRAWNSNGEEWAVQVTVWPAIDSPQHFISKRILRFSDELKTYLINYTKDISSELLNINSDRQDASIRGLNAPAGIDNEVDVSYIYNNILSRERPLIEFDSMLCELFGANKMIAKQLMNLNFVFNLEDVSYVNQNNLLCNNVNIEFRFGYLDSNNQFNAFDYKDIYTNYNFIPSYKLDINGGNYDLTGPNVLDYLDDNKCIDFIYINKTTQPICHWTLVEKPDYIYNFYGGFSPYYEGNQIVGSYYGMPRIEDPNYNVSLNSIGWCGRLTEPSANILMSEVSRIGTTSKATLVPNFFNSSTNSIEVPDTYWIDWLKYSRTQTDEYEDLYNDLHDIFNSWDFYFELIDEEQYQVPDLGSIYNIVFYINGMCENYGLLIPDSWTNPKKFLICMSSYDTNGMNSVNINSFTLKNFKDLEIVTEVSADPGTQIDTNIFTNDVLTSLIRYIQLLVTSPIPPVKFVFDRGIVPVNANPKNINTTEIRYLKANENTYNYVYRYTDHLQPMFIDCNDNKNLSILYNSEWKCNSFENVDEAIAQKYNDGIISKEEPVYPSIGYFPLSIINDYSNSQGDNTHYFSVPQEYKDHLDEYIWFDKSSSLVLPSTVNIQIQLSASLSQTEILDIVKSELNSYLSGFNTLKDFDNNVWPLYEYSVNFEYADLDDIDHINYYITYTLR